ncbi:hypothetical protein Pcinc_012239 [Petrolisthes cinctipes]|uniref:Uncharacterized protein n=1 Tax=Petrolisthes cinctipes TaxID=88211 RepID=A0AAE1KTR8_PETCI|nr:hypothetical protein Pcinc_012239 [Petrolisthes cinctipes]
MSHHSTSRFKSQARNVIWNVYRYFSAQWGGDSSTEVLEKTAKATHVSEKTVKRIKRQASECDPNPLSSPVYCPKKLHVRYKLDAFDKECIRNEVLSFYERGEIPTIDDLLDRVREEPVKFEEAKVVLLRDNNYDNIDKKKAGWKKISECFNSTYPLQEKKNETQLKRAWEYIRNKVKKLHGEYVKKKRATGGGPPPTPPKYDALMEATASLIGYELVFADQQYDDFCRELPNAPAPAELSTTPAQISFSEPFILNEADIGGSAQRAGHSLQAYLWRCTMAKPASTKLLLAALQGVTCKLQVPLLQMTSHFGGGRSDLASNADTFLGECTYVDALLDYTTYSELKKTASLRMLCENIIKEHHMGGHQLKVSSFFTPHRQSPVIDTIDPDDPQPSPSGVLVDYDSE